MTATRIAANVLHIEGAGFAPDQELRVVAIPNLSHFDGPPAEASIVTYPVVDSQGSFTIDVDVTEFPLDGTRTQVVAFEITKWPLASTMYTA